MIYQSLADAIGRTPILMLNNYAEAVQAEARIAAKL